MDIGFVYLWENTLNSKKYIGSHKGVINDNYIGSGVYFKRAYNNNKDFFKRTILYAGKNYRFYEEKLLKKLNVAYSEEYYNLKNDAIGGWEHTHNNSEIIKRRNQGISKAKKGIYFEWLKYDKSGCNNPMYNKKHSESAIKLISEKRRLRTGSTNNRKVIEYNSGQIFDSLTACGKFYNLSQPTISYLLKIEVVLKGVCKGKRFGYV
jgi:hypothetical protein